MGNKQSTAAAPAHDAPPLSTERQRVFISLRFGEAMKEAKQLKAALERAGISTFLCDVPEGEDVARVVVRALNAAEMAIILGTATYGKDTGAGYSTFQEMRFIINEGKPFFLVKMCDAFEEEETRFRFGKEIMYFMWKTSTPMPAELVPRILAKLNQLPKKTGTPTAGEAGTLWSGAAAAAAIPYKPRWAERADFLQASSTNVFIRLLRSQHSRILAGYPEYLSQLEVYVPLTYSLQRPPLPTSERTFELNTLMRALLEGSLDTIFGKAGVFTSRGVVVQGAAGTGKTLFGWRLMQYWDQLGAETQSALAIPIVITLPAVTEEVKRVMDSDEGASRFILKQLINTYNVIIPEFRNVYEQLKPDELAEVYSHPFVFVLDGADELVDKLPLHQLLNLKAWTHSVFVVTSRTGFYSDDSEAKAYAFGPAQNNALLAQSIHILPFSDEQIQRYVEGFARAQHSLYGWEARQYNDALGQFPHMKEFVREPLLLYLTLNVLPLMSASQHRHEHVSNSTSPSRILRLNRFFLQVVDIKLGDSVGEETREAAAPLFGDVFPVLKRAELYSLFAYSWAEREARKMGKVDKESNEVDGNFLDSILDFCEKMAFSLFLHHHTQYKLGFDHSSRAATFGNNSSAAGSGSKKGVYNVRAYRQHAASAEEPRGDGFLDELLQSSPEEFRCSPIKRSGDVFSFLHKTLQEYFVAMHIMRELGKCKCEEGEEFEQVLVSGNLSSLSIAKQLLTDGNVLNTLRFCGDFVDIRAQYYISIGPVVDREKNQFAKVDGTSFEQASPVSEDRLQPSARALWDIVQASRLDVARQHPSTAVAAVNALMILNAAGMQFDGCDLSYATLGWRHTDTHGNALMVGDFSGAIFSNTNLSNACLAQARLDGCCFDKANLEVADLTGATFGQLPMLQGHTGWVNSVCVTPDGKYIVSGSVDKTVRMWSVDTGKQIRQLDGHAWGVSSVCVTPDGKHIVSGSDDHSVRLWSVDTGQQTRQLDGHTWGVSSVCITADGKHVVSSSSDKTVRVWSMDTGQQIRQLDGHTDRVYSICVTPDGKHIVSGSSDKTVRVWSMDTGQQIRQLEGHIDGVNSVCVTPDGEHIVSGSYDKTVRVWSVDTGQQIRQLDGHTDGVTSVFVTPNGKHIVSGSGDNTVRVWSVDTGEPVRQLDGNTGSVNSVCVTPDGRHIVSALWDSTVRVWSLDTGQQIRQLDGHIESVSSVCVTPDGEHVVSGSYDNTVRLWSVDTGQQIHQLDGHTEDVSSVCVTPDGKHIVSASYDKTVRVWSVNTGEQIRQLNGHTAFVTCVCVTPNGKHIVSGSWDKTVRVWSVDTGQQIRQLDGHADWVHSVCVTPDGTYIVSGSQDETVRLWSVDKGQQIRQLDGHTSYVYSVCVTPDGKHIVSGSEDDTVRVWSVDTGQQIRQLDGHTDTVTSVCVMPDGEHIVSGAEDDTVRVWSLKTFSFVRFGKVDDLVIASSLPRDLRVIIDGSHIRIKRDARVLFVLGNQSVLSFEGCSCFDVQCDAKSLRLMEQLGAVVTPV